MSSENGEVRQPTSLKIQSQDRKAGGLGLAPKPPIRDIYCQACGLLVQVCVRIVQSSDLEPSSEHQI